MRKLQIAKHRLQTSSKDQVQKEKPFGGEILSLFGACNLRFAWNLVLGAWDFIPVDRLLQNTALRLGFAEYRYAPRVGP